METTLGENRATWLRLLEVMGLQARDLDRDLSQRIQGRLTEKMSRLESKLLALRPVCPTWTA